MELLQRRISTADTALEVDGVSPGDAGNPVPPACVARKSNHIFKRPHMRKQTFTLPYKPCPVERTIELFSGRWKSAIIYHLRKKPVRFNELQRQIPFISQRMLTYQLRRLETDGLVLRVEHREKQPRVVYSLTSAGHSLGDVVLAIHKWGKRNESLLPSPTVAEPQKRLLNERERIRAASD